MRLAADSPPSRWLHRALLRRRPAEVTSTAQEFSARSFRSMCIDSRLASSLLLCGDVVSLRSRADPRHLIMDGHHHDERHGLVDLDVVIRLKAELLHRICNNGASRWAKDV